MGAPLAEDATPTPSTPEAVCLVVFCCDHTNGRNGEQYTKGDSLNVTPVVRDKLRYLQAIY